MPTDILRKNRTISLRLSENEFEALKEVCRTRGARSVSDFARAAMHRLIETGMPEGDGELPAEVSSRLEELNSRIDSLGREVARLAALVPGETAGVEPEPRAAEADCAG